MPKFKTLTVYMEQKSYYKWDKNNLRLELHVKTQAAKDAIIGEYNNRLKVTITARAKEGEANTCLIKFLAKHFKIPQKQVMIIKGQQNKFKSILIQGVRESALPSELQETP